MADELRRGAERMGERATAARDVMGERATAAKEAVEERATAAKEATAEAIASVKPQLRGEGIRGDAVGRVRNRRRLQPLQLGPRQRPSVDEAAGSRDVLLHLRRHLYPLRALRPERDFVVGDPLRRLDRRDRRRVRPDD